MSAAQGWQRLQRLLVPAEQGERIYDAVIVGAGLSGLRAAHGLRGRRILVLEKEARVGGRVLTRTQAGVHYDLGAVLGYNLEAIGVSVKSSPLLREEGPIGCYHEGQVRFGANVLECISGTGLGEQHLEQIARFQKDPERTAASLPDPLPGILGTFFQNIHFGRIDEYLPERRLDALRRFSTDRYERGNGELVEALASPDIQLDAEVVAVREKVDLVEIEYRQGGRTHRVHARLAIVSSPGPIALRLLERVSETSRTFLSSLRYTEGTVVAIGLQGSTLTKFSYIATPGLASSTVLRHASASGDIEVLLTYYASDVSARLREVADAELVEQTRELLARLQIGDVSRERTLFTDVQRWPLVGPVITKESYAAWDKRAARPSRRVFLAGDYLQVDPHNVLPYGMTAAVRSGAAAAREAQQFLEREAKLGKVAQEFLTEVSIYELCDDRPVFRWKTQEGTVAFNGIVLQAEPNEDLRDYLLDCAVDGLWEYQPGFGVTPEDSALVMEGLLAAGVAPGALRASAARLVELFFDERAGAFVSLSERRRGAASLAQGRSRYWEGPSLGATAHVGYLLHRIDADAYRDIIAACQRYVAAHQHPGGYWQEKWFPSTLLGTYQVARLLSLDAATYQDRLGRAREYIGATKRPNHSWFNSVLDTSAAILSLSAMGVDAPLQAKAKAWLTSMATDGRWRGEPLLYYWIEAEGKKLMYHCHDKGRVTTAWAKLALCA